MKQLNCRNMFMFANIYIITKFSQFTFTFQFCGIVLVFPLYVTEKYVYILHLNVCSFHIAILTNVTKLFTPAQTLPVVGSTLHLACYVIRRPQGSVLLHNYPLLDEQLLLALHMNKLL